jgi:hypothetical protein
MKETVTLNQDALREWQNEDMEPLRYAYDLLPEDAVLDIGSYQREWGGEIEKRYGCKVEYFDALDNRAAWKYDGTIKTGGAYYYTSMFAEDKPNEYRCFDIAPFLTSEVRLVKINIEGGEYELLQYIIEKGLMKNIVDLQVQFHLIEGMDCDKLYSELAKELSKTHKLTWRYPFVWENWQRKSEADKMFKSV